MVIKSGFKLIIKVMNTKEEKIITNIKNIFPLLVISKI